MILWCDGAHDVAENMRRDAALLAAAERGAPPVLRLFGFSPPGITLGRNQEPARELDLAHCAADRVGWAVRPTGGRAIFHDQEWTYALASPHDDAEWGGGASDTYAQASALILRALVRLGVPAEMVGRRSPAGATSTLPAPAPRVPGAAATPCFASSARHEVVVERRKLVGSAQRRTAGGWLQQGSVLLGEGHLRIADYLAIPDASRSRVRESLRLAAGSAAPWLGPRAPIERFADALLAELPLRSQRLEGASGGYLLTMSGSGSYTAPFI
jgi:lipoyl(octanoyl) transferase